MKRRLPNTRQGGSVLDLAAIVALVGWTILELTGPTDRLDDAVKYLEEISGTRISAIGVGQDRDETISIHDLIG